MAISTLMYADLPLPVIGDAAGFRDSFETRGDVDTIGRKYIIVAVDDDVADMDADTKFDPLMLQ